MRHLTPIQALTHLRLGKTLEQWLGTRPDGSDTVLRWIQVCRDPVRGYVVTLFEGFEDPSSSSWAVPAIDS